MGLKEDILHILADAAAEMRVNMETQGINASGRTADSIIVQSYDGGARIVGGNDKTHAVATNREGVEIYAPDTAPIPTLQYGRAGGLVPKGFYYIIKQWSRDKGISFARESERSTFAYFVAQKIADSGTKRNSNPADVYSTPVEKAVGQIRDLFRAEVAKTTRAAIGRGGVISRLN